MSSTDLLDACVLVGDSITQTTQNDTLYQHLSEYFERRLDVVNRGHGGFNTEWTIPVLKRALTPKVKADQGHGQKIRVMTLWLGTNDAALPPAATHVPVDQYKANLHEIISLVKSPDSPYYSPETKIILLTPPPVIAEVWRKGVADWAILSGLMSPEEMVAERDHDPKVMAGYAKACLEVGQEAGLDAINVHAGIIEAAGGDSPAKLLPYFSDGIHMTGKGYDVVFTLFKELIERKYPKLTPANMVMGIIDFSLLGKGDIEALIAENQEKYHAQWTA
ncbi:hypothetical protein CI109_106696 [Kwoniella shandongensis]|uniref:Uncharacterized protein n=1 Tax=Kwoniella shandongensis TaxID=1734106 RepID=A0A5M6BQT8_9TREE|nr:uncharacterized protein CI109_006434 [Kwoniella shandongensis]KAA5525264.1 hypothetical protein CI109_006434 [Kwoniella shandongensis]